MAQETTEEFAHRLRMAVKAHPLAPPTPHGSQRWLLRRLETETGLAVSQNTVHKWYTGTSRPRGDNLRKLAKVLSVDEVWLSLGRKPVVDGVSLGAAASGATGAILVIAGMIEMAGGRVTFAGTEGAAHLHVSLGGSNTSVIAVAPQAREQGKVTFLVPEPVGSSRVVGVLVDEMPGHSASIDLLDLTNAPRQNHGGFSTLSVETRGGGKFKVGGEKSLRTAMPSVAALVQ